jgi:O-methyltransferase involved in polyketide biosynthesis
VFDATNLALAAARVFDRRHPPLRDALLQRHAMIDHLVAASGITQIIELAAGLSRRGAAVTCDPRIRYVEIDLPHVVDKKRALLERSDEGRAVLARTGFRMVGADVADLDLGKLVTPGEPVFVIAEGLAMYLVADARRRLFANIHALAAAAGTLQFVFDLTPTDEQPAPGVVGRALEAAMKTFTGGRSFERDAPSRGAIVDELRAAGFADVEPIAARDVARAWRLPSPEVMTPTLVFSASGSRASSS